MTEIEQFVKFFKSMGISYYHWNYGSEDEIFGNIPREVRATLTVSQALFHFDAVGKYLGVESDEMGGFSPREPK